MTHTGIRELREEPTAYTPKVRWEALLSSWHLKARGFSHPPGRNDLPGALLDLCAEGRFNRDVDDWAALQAFALEHTWTSAEFPSMAIHPDIWVDLFEEVGFLHNGKMAQRPQFVPTLFRAAVQGVTGLSWTESRDKAEWFHKRNIDWGLRAVLVERDDVHPFEVLARFHDEENGRGEHEWVIDPFWEN